MKFCDERIQKHLLNGGKIKRESCDFSMFLNNEGLLCYQCDYVYTCCINKKDLTANDWEIVEPEYDWDKIVKDKILCQFWNGIKKTDDPCVGYLSKKAAEGFYRKGWNCSWLHCKPFNPADFNIAKNIKEYEK